MNYKILPRLISGRCLPVVAQLVRASVGAILYVLCRFLSQLKLFFRIILISFFISIISRKRATENGSTFEFPHIISAPQKNIKFHWVSGQKPLKRRVVR